MADKIVSDGTEPLAEERHEAFAQALARGARAAQAFVAAGYDPASTHRARVAKRPDIRARVRVLTLERSWGGSPDLAPVINEFMRLAKACGMMPDGAGMANARLLLVEAARLKLLLRDRAEALEPELSGAEWMAEFGAKDG